MAAERISQADTYYEKDFSFANETVLVIDCYYKIIAKGEKPKLHFAKFSGEYLIFASEDERDDDGTLLYPNGYYEHGIYPFFFDFVYPAEQSVAGFGYCDVIKPLQDYIDSLDSLIQVNNRLAGKPRMIVSKNLGIGADELSDTNREILMAEGEINPQMIYKLDIDALPAQVIAVRDARIAELKEIVGNRDFQQGGTANGVTSGTALSVLQSVGDKISRDIIQNSYRCYKRIVLCIIELIRQFYTVERTIRIIGKDGDYKFEKFDNSRLQRRGATPPNGSMLASTPTMQGEPLNGVFGQDLGVIEDGAYGVDMSALSAENEDTSGFLGFDDDDIPYFDVKLSVQKTNPYSRELANQTILELANLGLFNPQNLEYNMPVLSALQFEGKDELIKELGDVAEKIKEQQMQQMAMQQVPMQGAVMV